jgi:hypothetical protein
MLRKIERFDEDLIRGTLVNCPDGERREFWSFDEDGDLIVAAPDLNGKSGEVVFHAEDCQLKT